VPSSSGISGGFVENIRLIELRHRGGVRLETGVAVGGAVRIARAQMARHVSAIVVKAFGIVRVRLIGDVPPLLAVSGGSDFGDGVVDALAIACPSDVAVMGVVCGFVDA